MRARRKTLSEALEALPEAQDIPLMALKRYFTEAANRAESVSLLFMPVQRPKGGRFQPRGGRFLLPPLSLGVRVGASPRGS